MPKHAPVPQMESTAESPMTERRRWVRFSTDLEALCTPAGAESTNEAERAWAARVLNISQGGIALSVARRFERNTGLVIDLLIPSDPPPQSLRARVARIAKAPSGNWIVGCEFLWPISEEELWTILEQG
jgi:hypothetical protein